MKSKYAHSSIEGHESNANIQTILSQVVFLGWRQSKQGKILYF